MSFAIDLLGISKSYEDTIALRDVSLRVEEGRLFGIIGPDGAGKTSLFRIMATLILADKGSATVMDIDVQKGYREIRNILGYMPGRFSLYQDLTVEENLNLFASIYGTTVKEQYHLIKEIYDQLEPFKTRRAGKLSGGMKQKLALCCALVHKPKILLLDEPTTGVDPVSRKEFWQMLKRLQKFGITIVVSTPYMDEATLCEHVALIQKGSILSIEKPQEIIDQYPRQLYSVIATDKYKLLKDLRDITSMASAFAFGESVHYSDNRKELSLPDLANQLEQKGHKNVIVSETKATVEDCFMELMTTEEGNE